MSHTGLPYFLIMQLKEVAECYMEATDPKWVNPNDIQSLNQSLPIQIMELFV